MLQTSDETSEPVSEAIHPTAARHFDEESLADLIWKLLQAPDPVVASAVRDLTGLCPSCDTLLVRFFFHSEKPQGAEPEEAERRIRRLVRNWLTDNAQERRAATRLASELLATPAQRRHLLLRNRESLHTWAVCGELCETSRRLAPEDPKASLEAADLAVEVAKRIDPVAYGPDILADIRATAQAFYGNAVRVSGNLAGAEEAFRRARRYLAEGSGHGVARLQVAELEATLRSAQSRTAEALELLDEVLALHREAGDDHRQGRTLIKRAEICRHGGRPEEAMEVLAAAEELADFDAEPRLAFVLEHTRCYCLIDLGRYTEAARQLETAQALAQKVGLRLDALRVEWLVAKIDLVQGRIGTAAGKLRSIRDAFLDLEMGFDAALASLELAILYLERGMTEPVKRLAVEMLAIFQSGDVHREAVAALIVFQQAALMEQASVGIALEVRDFLSRARRDRRLAFRDFRSSSEEGQG
ncbi:MAG: hypothetical protein KDD11_19700 [Acidobacteria bacterium]|nr:hypothetical protein [Acidobacteriota bacterium]